MIYIQELSAHNVQSEMFKIKLYFFKYILQQLNS